MELKDWLLIFVPIVTAIISGVFTYLATRSKYKHELKLQEIEHRHEIELLSKEAESKIGETLISKAAEKMMDSPEFKKEVGKRMNKQFASKKGKRR